VKGAGRADGAAPDTDEVGAVDGTAASATQEAIVSPLARRSNGTCRSLLAVAALATALVLDTGGVSAATVVQSWQTRIGDGPGDNATIQVYDTGKGVLRLRAADTDLSGSSTYTVTIHKGSCGWIVSSVGPALFKLPSVRTSASGAITKNLAVTAAQARKVRSSWNAGAGVTIVFRKGSSGYCADFAILGRVGQSIRVENEQVHVVTAAERWAGTGRGTPEAGGAYVTVYVRITAIAATSYDERTYSFRDPEGTDWTRPMILWDEREPALGDGDLAPGEVAEGWVTSIAPVDDLDSLTLVYWMHSTGIIGAWDTASALVPLGTLGGADGGGMPSPSPSPAASPSTSPSPGP
jgi:hypothetical protein